MLQHNSRFTIQFCSFCIKHCVSHHCHKSIRYDCLHNTRRACISIREIFVRNLLVAPQLLTVSSDSHINWSAAQWVELNTKKHTSMKNWKSHRDERQTSSHYHANNWTHHGIKVSIIFIYYTLFFVCLIYNSDPLEVCILQPWALDADIVLSLFVVCFVSNAQITRPPRHFECVPTSWRRLWWGRKKWMLIANFMSNVKAEGLECREKCQKSSHC